MSREPEGIFLEIKLDKSKAHAEIAIAEGKNKEVEQQVVETDDKITRIATKANVVIADTEARLQKLEEHVQASKEQVSVATAINMQAMRATVQTFQSILSLMGVALDPVAQATLTAIMSTVEMLYAMSAAHTAAGLPTGVYIATIASWLQVVAAMQAQAGFDRAKELINTSVELMNAWG